MKLLRYIHIVLGILSISLGTYIFRETNGQSGIGALLMLFFVSLGFWLVIRKNVKNKDDG